MPSMVPTAQVEAAPWVLLYRAYCHLCDQMLERAREFGLEPALVHVDEHPDLLERWDEKVPVLLHNGIEVCYYTFDEQAVRLRVR